MGISIGINVGLSEKVPGAPGSSEYYHHHEVPQGIGQGAQGVVSETMEEGQNMTITLKPNRGGFLRPFGCGLFVRDFLLGSGPHGSMKIKSEVGAPQADIFYHYPFLFSSTTPVVLTPTGPAPPK
jgi:hypothetical protein